MHHVMFCNRESLLFLLVCIISWHVTVQKEVGEACTVQNSREAGICKSILECPYAKEQFDRYRTRPTRCGSFIGNNIVICCVEKGSSNVPIRQPTNQFMRRTTARPSPNNQKPGGGSISERKCEEYSSHVREVTYVALAPGLDPIRIISEKCEYQHVQLILGGKNAKLGEYPHMAAIGWTALDGGYLWNCGGTLISETFVVTAAHCTYYGGSEVRSAKPSVIRLGEHNLRSTNDGANPIDMRIKNTILHPNYKSTEKYNDIALFELSNSVRFNTNLRPACLWKNPNIEETKAAAIGWGATNGSLSSDILQTVTLDVVNTNVCKPYYEKKRSQRGGLKNGLVEEQLCAGKLTGGYDACQGDSGGPLQIYSKKNRCIHYLIGITSFGNGCGLANTLGVYTKVSSYVKWIEDKVWPNQ